MSNNETNNNDIVIKFELPQIVNKALTPLASSIGTTLSTAWKGFTIGIDTWYDKKKIEHEHNLSLYAREIQRELSSIPEDSIQEPKMSIIGPSLEASKYYFEEEWYRIMFAKLIAGSCDNRKNDIIHPFFVEAIKQITSLDAKIIKSFKDKENQPIAKYRVRFEDKFSDHNYMPYVFILSDVNEDLENNLKSIINLKRLGFVEVDFKNIFTDDNIYLPFKTNPTYLKIKAEIESSVDSYPKGSLLEIKKGIILLTPLGKAFLDICI